MSAIGTQAKPFARRVAGNARGIAEVVVSVDSLMDDPDRTVQEELCRMLVAFLGDDPRLVKIFVSQSQIRETLLLRDYAPFAAAVLRIYLVFKVSLALEFVRRDPNSLADLQYLCYVPFCTGFCSNDKLHERMFPAVSGPAIFLPAETLKADLLRRKAWRESLGRDGWATHRSEYGIHPMEFEGSLINEVWNKTMQPSPKTPHRVTPENLGTLQNDPRFWAMVDEMKSMVSDSKVTKQAKIMQWPHGNSADSERPL